MKDWDRFDDGSLMAFKLVRLETGLTEDGQALVRFRYVTGIEQFPTGSLQLRLTPAELRGIGEDLIALADQPSPEPQT